MKRQDYVFGSTTSNVTEQTATDLNNGWVELSILYSRVLNGVLKALSSSTNDVSQEVANAIVGMGTELNPLDSSQLLSILQTMALKASDFESPITASNKGATMKEIEEVATSSLTFKGFVATSQPTQVVTTGNIWINSATMPTNFPVAASSIKQWNGASWVAYGSDFTPADFDFFRNNNNNEGYYWFGGEWKIMSTDMSTEYFTLNQTSGKWEISAAYNNTLVHKTGNETIDGEKTFSVSPRAPTPNESSNDTTMATTAFVNSKISGLAAGDYVVETSLVADSNGLTWYRKYKSHWVEQGGVVTGINPYVTFPIPMSNLNYSWTVSNFNQYAGERDVRLDVYNRSTTGMTITNTNSSGAANNTTATWEVKGYY